ncbi:MAG: S1 RNA-binding domain-containing protein [Opitutales bacterium]
MLHARVMIQIGKYNRLKVLHETQSGYYLDGEHLGEILLPGAQAPKDLAWGSEIEVFLYPDSEDRLVATTQKPKATAGEFAALEVLSVHPRIGAFLDWGLGKDLLLPYREQGAERVAEGDRVVVCVLFDERSSRLIASTRLARHMRKTPPPFTSGQRVSFLVSHRTPLGYQAIVEDGYSGLLYHSGLGSTVRPGERLEGYVTGLRPDGKVDLSLDPGGPRRTGDLAEQILEALEAHDGRLPYDDYSSPDEIRAQFDTSKKAFKRALATLYKARRIRFPEAGGIERA